MQELMQTGSGTFSIASKFHYDPFGKPLKTTGANERQTYIDKERDVESGLGDHGVRKYDYETGRFTTIDPLWQEYMGFNPYHYCHNNPVLFLDPIGLASYYNDKGIALGTDGNKETENDVYFTTQAEFDDAKKKQ